MPTQVIVLNGGSSSGKSTVARCLQQSLLPEPWLAFSIDDLLHALPASLHESDDGIEIGEDGAVNVGDSFRTLEAAWLAGIAAMVRAGARVVADDVFLGQAASQERWRTALAGLDVLWVGVRCDPAVAARREAARGDRAHGMAELQAEVVHQGVHYDLEVDSTLATPQECAEVIAAHVSLPRS